MRLVTCVAASCPIPSTSARASAGAPGEPIEPPAAIEAASRGGAATASPVERRDDRVRPAVRLRTTQLPRATAVAVVAALSWGCAEPPRTCEDTLAGCAETEDCGNHVDDNGDGAVDCADSECQVTRTTPT